MCSASLPELFTLPEFIHQTADRASIGAGGSCCDVSSATGGSDLNYRRPLVNSWRDAFTTRFLALLYGGPPGSAGTAAGDRRGFLLNFWFLKNMRSITNYEVLRIRIRVILRSWIRIRIRIKEKAGAGSGFASKWKGERAILDHWRVQILEKVSGRNRIRIKLKGRIRIRIKVKSRIRIRIKVMRIRNTAAANKPWF